MFWGRYEGSYDLIVNIIVIIVISLDIVHCVIENYSNINFKMDKTEDQLYLVVPME